MDKQKQYRRIYGKTSTRSKCKCFMDLLSVCYFLDRSNFSKKKSKVSILSWPKVVLYRTSIHVRSRSVYNVMLINKLQCKRRGSKTCKLVLFSPPIERCYLALCMPNHVYVTDSSLKATNIGPGQYLDGLPLYMNNRPCDMILDVSRQAHTALWILIQETPKVRDTTL